MILEQNNNNTFTFGNIIDTSVDAEDLAKLKGIVSSSLYSDSWSWLRESVSNAVDVHKLVGTDKKVEVYIDVDNVGRFIGIQDYGTGISPEFMDKVFSKIGKSTKMNSNDQIGFFGLGRMAVLAYTDSAYYITNVDGIRYTYLLTKNNGAEFILVKEEETDLPNGTLVKVYLKESSHWYLDKVNSEICEKCAYFEDVVYENFTNPLYKSDVFYYTPDFKGDSYMHISYGGCYYKFPYEKLGLEKLKIPVAIPVELGLLKPTPNREELQLDNKSIKMLKEKYEALIAYIKSVAPLEFDDLRAWSNARSYGQFELINGLKVKYSDVGIQDELIYKPLVPLQLRNIFPSIKVHTVEKTKLSTRTDSITIEHRNLLIKDVNYLNELHFRNYVQDREVIETHKYNLHDCILFLGLKNHPKSEWRTLINLYVNWFKDYFKIQTFSEIKKSQDFKDFVTENRIYNTGVKRDKITWVARWSDKGNRKVVWDSNRFSDCDRPVIVTNNTDKNTIEWLYSLISKTNIKMIKVGKGEKEDFEWIKSHEIISKVYYNKVIKDLLSSNNGWLRVAQLCEVPTNLTKLKELSTVEYRISDSLNESGFFDSLKDLIDLNNLNIDEYEKAITEFKSIVDKYEYFYWLSKMSSSYYDSTWLMKIHNYIQSLKNPEPVREKQIELVD